MWNQISPKKCEVTIGDLEERCEYCGAPIRYCRCDQVPIDIPPSVLSRWDGVRSMLKAQISRQTFERWIMPLLPAGFEDGIMTLSAPTGEGRDVVQTQLMGALSNALSMLYPNSQIREFRIVCTTEREVA